MVICPIGTAAILCHDALGVQQVSTGRRFLQPSLRSWNWIIIVTSVLDERYCSVKRQQTSLTTTCQAHPRWSRTRRILPGGSGSSATQLGFWFFDQSSQRTARRRQSREGSPSWNLGCDSTRLMGHQQCLRLTSCLVGLHPTPIASSDL